MPNTEQLYPALFRSKTFYANSNCFKRRFQEQKLRLLQLFNAAEIKIIVIRFLQRSFTTINHIKCTDGFKKIPAHPVTRPQKRLLKIPRGQCLFHS